MDLLSIQRKNFSMQNRWGSNPYPEREGASEEKADRISQLVKRVDAKKPIKTKWGGKDYPVDIKDYGQFMSTLQTLSWVLRDVGYDISYLTRNGLQYGNGDYLNYPVLFDNKQSKVVALVAIGKDGRHYRFSRDGSSLRVRKFDNVTRAIAPMPSVGDPSSKPISADMVKEIVRVMKSQSMLNPGDEASLRRWGRVK